MSCMLVEFNDFVCLDGSSGLNAVWRPVQHVYITI